MRRAPIAMRVVAPMLGVASWFCSWQVAAQAADPAANQASELKRQADQLLSQGKHAAAVTAYRKAIAADPSHTAAFGALSLHFLRSSDFTRAAALLRQAVAHNPDYAEGWYNLAYALRKQGRFDEAIAAYRRNSKLAPQSADPHYGIGLALEAQGEHAEAAVSFRRYAAMETRSSRKEWIARASSLASKLERRSGKRPPGTTPPAAEETATAPSVAGEAAKFTPAAGTPAPPAGDRASHRRTSDSGSQPAPSVPETSAAADTPQRRAAQRPKQAGDALARAGRFAEAAVEYRRAIAIDYTYLAAYNELGNALFRLARYPDAIKVFRVALRDNPDYALGWYNLAYALRKAGRLPEAITAYRQFSRARPRDPDPYFGLGLTHEAMGHKQQAVEAFRRYVELERRPSHQQWVERARERASALGGAPLPDPAAAASVAAAQPKSLTRAELRQQRVAERRRLLEQARAERAESRRQRLEQQRRRAEEREAQQLAAATPGTDRPAGSTTDGGGKAGTDGPARAGSGALAAGAATGVAVAPAPDRPTTIPAPEPASTMPGSAAGKLRVQADTLARHNNCAEALPLYDQALAADPFVVAAYDGIAYCAYRSGDYVAGTRKLSIGLRDNPDYLHGWLHLARLQRLAGQDTHAVGSYRRYLRDAGHRADPSGHFELARALRAAGLGAGAIAAYRAYLEVERRQEAAPQRAAAFAELEGLGGSAPSGAAPSVGAVSSVQPRPGDLDHASASPPARSPSKAEQRRLARLERQRKLAEAREERQRKLAEAREERQRKLAEAREERQRKLAQAREERLAAAQAREERLAAAQGVVGDRQHDAARQRARDRAEDALIAKMRRRGAAARPLATALDRLPPAPAVEVDDARAHDGLRPAPEAARGLVEVADRMFARQRYLVALGIYRQAASLAPGATEPLYKAAVSAVVLGRMHLAADLFERVLQQDPTNATAAVNLKLARAVTRDSNPPADYRQETVDEAVRDLAAGRHELVERRLERMARGCTDGRVFALRAAARLGLGKAEQALSDAGRALALDPSNLGALALLGDAQRLLGNGKQARYYYRLFLARAPAAGQADAVRRKLAELAE